MKIKKIFKNISIFAISFFVIFLVFFAKNEAFAIETGKYTTNINTYIDNPFTNKPEDKGVLADPSSKALGESMARGVIGNVGLVEVDKNKNVYLTIRILKSFAASNIRYSYSTNGTFTNAPYQITAENKAKSTKDFRIKVPTYDAVIKVNMYVEPMGRDVICFIKASSLTPGTGDFTSLIDTNKEVKKEEPKQQEVVNKQPQTKTEQIQKQQVPQTVNNQQENVVKEDKQKEETALIQEDKKEEIEKPKEEVKEEKKEEDKKENVSVQNNKKFNHLVWIIPVVIGAVIFGIVFAVKFKNKK